MIKIPQYLLAILAIVCVSILGYYAYILSTTTLIFSFVGEEIQHGGEMMVTVQAPWLASNTSSGYIDRTALMESISKNGKKWAPTVSGEGYINIGDASIQISSTTWNKGDNININANLYNTLSNQKWKFPRDISLSYSDIPKGIEVEQIGLPKDLTYRLTVYGYNDLGPDDVRWYISTPPQNHHNCSMIGWNPGDWNRIKVSTIETHTTGVKRIGTYQLKLKEYPSDACIIAGLSGDSSPIVFSPLPTLSATGTITDILSPEYDMQSRIEFHFSTDIFTDTGTLYSREYMEHRQNAKIDFLKHLSISPEISITADDLELSPNKAIIYPRFIEGKQYRVDLDDIEDIYGRETSVHMDITAQSIPSLSLKLGGNKTIFKYGEGVPAKLYRTKGVKNEYEVKLCQIGIDGYARVERMNELKNVANTPSVYTLLKSNEVSNCTKKTIALIPGSSVAEYDVNGFLPKGLNPGLYILAFQNIEDVGTIDRWVAPRVFSIVDTHITMKIDASGKMQFLATDIRSGEPRSNQDIILRNNISQLYTQNWNTHGNNTYDIVYTPLSALSWGTGIVLGKTLGDGTLQKDKTTIDENNPYNLTSEWWGEYEGRYNSFIAVSKGDGHFGYVVSTWNDGITGWNFGLKESDYGWDNRPLYSAYVHTDRRLYLPGETVHIKGIVRKNEKVLTIPENELFDIIVTDSESKTIHTTRVKASAYGSIATQLDIPKDSPLGNYTVSIQSINDPNNYISNSYANFQVEIFSNPTFTAEVQLSSPHITNGVLNTIREVTNDDVNNPWYDKVYKSNFTIEGIVKAHYYNGVPIKSIPFTYRIYKSVHYDSSYWGDCFWGCYYEPTPEFYTEGTGTIDSDGYGALRVDVDFASFSDDYIYTAEVTIVDPLSGKSVTTPGTLLAQLGQQYKMYDINNPLQATIESRMLSPGTPIEAHFSPKYGKWDQSIANKYRYELIHRTYTSEKISTLRGQQSPIVHSTDTVIQDGTISAETLRIDTKGFMAGEYFLREIPITPSGIIAPQESIYETLIYITGDFVSKDTTLRVIPERTVYHNGETAHVLITTPFSSGGYLYITKERGGVIDHEYVFYSGSTYSRDYQIDDSFYPNVYIGAVAFPRGNSDDRSYAVGYSEIVMDISQKKGILNINTNKEIYKNRETVNMDISLTNSSGQGEPGELEVMVVDESLIRLLGNIDLDIIPKFFQKYPFTMKTALTAIGIERNRFMSRKGSNGGSGDKGGDGAQISSRTLFKNTAYYNSSLLTNKDGKARLSFQLPDNVTDYRIIVIGQTKQSEFSIAEKTIVVRRDYTLESSAPSIAYPEDTTMITASVFNTTPRITPIILSLEIGTGGLLFKKTEELILNPNQSLSHNFNIEVGKVWNGDIPYTLTISEKGNILDRISKSLHVAEPPIIPDMSHISGVTSTDVSVALPKISTNTRGESPVTISISDSPLQDPERVIASMIAYPYGCIEQTISSTMPNAVAIRLASELGITLNTKEAEKNLKDGVAKILKMQDISGGWKYWETDTSVNTHITPYVIRSLYEMRKLGIDIPDDVFKNGLDFITHTLSFSNTENSNGGSSDLDADLQAEIFATLAQGKHPKAIDMLSNIDTEKLSRHGYLIFTLGLNYLGKIDAVAKQNFETRMNSRKSESYWYWDDTADQAIYARFLLQIGESQKASTILVNMLNGVNLEGYSLSTQAKLQIFMALVELFNTKNALPSFTMTTGTLRIPVNPKNGTHRYSYTTRRSLVGNTLDISGLSGETQLYYSIILNNEPIDIFAVEAITHPELSVTRVFEKVDESKGMDTEGQFISTQGVTNGVFTKGALYRVRISVIPKGNTIHKYYLTLEDYIPGAWRPINPIFNTESSSTRYPSAEYGYWNGWTHIETKLDRVLATQEYIWDLNQPYTYTYYMRPEYTGHYLLPPVTAYFMYQPYIHATGTYEKITVQ